MSSKRNRPIDSRWIFSRSGSERCTFELVPGSKILEFRHVLERSQGPVGDEDRRVLNQYRQREVGTVAFEAKYTFLGGAAGMLLGFVWLAAFHFGDRGASSWPIVALTAAGAAFGLPLDLRRRLVELRERRAAAASRWDPVEAVGVVFHIVAEASQAVRIDDNESNTAWFLQVDVDQILCVWDWADEATEHIEVDLIPAASPTALAIRWSGKRLAPIRQKRKFKRGERQPAQCEVLRGNVEQLDELLRQRTSEKGDVDRKKRAEPTLLSKLAEELEPLGFYKYVAGEDLESINEAAGEGAYRWFLEVGRAFDADAERLAEGGVEDLLDYLRPALKTEGCELQATAQIYDSREGYIVTIGEDRHTMWNQSEAKNSWELTTIRAAALINGHLERVGSRERVHLLNGGEDSVFVLLTTGMRDALAASGLFRPDEIPAPTFVGALER